MFPDLDASVVYDVRLQLPLKRVVLIRYTMFLQPQVPVTFDLFFFSYALASWLYYVLQCGIC